MYAWKASYLRGERSPRIRPLAVAPRESTRRDRRMPMPTTRRGRYLYYQARYKRRLRRLYKSGARGLPFSHCQHNYRYEFERGDLQSPKRYPKVWWTAENPFLFPLPDDVKGGKGVWPVHRLHGYTDHDHDPPYHNQDKSTLWAFRRIHKVPKPRHCSHVYEGPLIVPPGEMTPEQWAPFWKWEYYPSGQRNPYWDQRPGGDDYMPPFGS